jgi:hypothetical protein
MTKTQEKIMIEQQEAVYFQIFLVTFEFHVLNLFRSSCLEVRSFS